MKTVVLIPCYNEERSIEKVVSDFKKELPNADIYVYDNNSTDKTVEIAEKAGAIIRHEYRQGKGNVVRSMFRDIDADCYILVDGDDTYPVENAKEFEELILYKKADMVIGDRLSSTYFTENKRRFHNFGNKLLRFMINSIFKSNLNDILTGYRAFSYYFVKSFPISSKEFEIESEMTIFALNHNFLIEEIPVKYRDREEGSFSKLNTYSDGFKVIKLILSLFRTTKPLFYFSIITLIFFAIALIYFTPIYLNFLVTGHVDKIPTLIVISVIIIVSIILFFTGLILEHIKKHNLEDFEHHLTLLYENRKK